MVTLSQKKLQRIKVIEGVVEGQSDGGSRGGTVAVESAPGAAAQAAVRARGCNLGLPRQPGALRWI